MIRNAIAACSIALVAACATRPDLRPLSSQDDIASRIGIGRVDSLSGCVALPRRSVNVESIIALVYVPAAGIDDEAAAVEAVVTGPAARASVQCLPTAVEDSMSYYSIRLESTITRAPVYFALLASSRAVSLRGSSAALTWELYTAPVTLRSCTSNEGLHLTAWRGEPLRSRRVFHIYQPLGYDTELSCSRADMLVLPAGDEDSQTLSEPAPACKGDSVHDAASFSGKLARGERLSRKMRGGWILNLTPDESGWFISVGMKGREDEDISRITIPWHFMNARGLDGWHFRNAANTTPNDGSVNAPGRMREFIFSPRVGRDLEPGGTSGMAEVEAVAAFGKGWVFLNDYALSPPKEGERASFTKIGFTACLLWDSRR